MLQQRPIQLLMVLLRVRRRRELHHRRNQILHHLLARTRGMTKLLHQQRRHGPEMRRRLPEAILIMLKATRQRLKHTTPQLALIGILQIHRPNNPHGILVHIRAIPRNDRLEVIKEGVEESIDGDLAEGAAGLIGLGETGGGPLDQLGEDGAEGSVVELVDHLERGAADDGLDFIELGVLDLEAGGCDDSPYVEGVEEE